ncbi:LysR family transcriptional regulator [Noviherbaspirillum pedocola]|uniref:LysR family transcriptional regulator n=1 Tax=Noviherbaspirillum pedocola TaxID=2801341 RepID=A0A934SWW1_9BURK|nr:LysR family transcriptional regulator [Noviherbaspirillum pedocola]MBK4734189.1 LysR family transcriptional regulator [Noviherbaspirillum pedocola]
MNSDDLECFARVAHCGSISRAAMELGSDQSKVSRQLLRLEATVKSRLFHRNGRGVVLTDAGRTLLEHAKRVTRTIEEARHAIHALSEAGPAELSIGAQPTIARTLFGPLATVLHERFPHTRLRFVEGLAGQVLPWLTSGTVDLALLYLPAHAGGLKADILLQERVRLITPAGETGIGPEFAVRELGNIPLILPSAPHGMRLLAESLASRAGIALHVVMECDASISVIKRLVETGCGYSLLPLAAVAEEAALGRLGTAALVGPEVWRDVALATPRNRTFNADLWPVVNAVRQEVRDLVANGSWPDTRLRDDAV